MNATFLPLSAAIILLLIAPTLAASPEPPTGAASCSGCHAKNPNVDSTIPRLVGRKAEEIVSAMQGFKTGQRPSTVMDRMAKGFSDSEIQAIADWYAKEK
jgi:sulfide dehydrogenase cytochrome subunit